MPPLSVPLSDSNPSDAFFDQFSTIIRLEAHLHGDHSEDAMGVAHQHWAVKHLSEVAQAQGFASQVPLTATAPNMQAPEFVTPPSAQPATSNPQGYITPWHENFNLADQGVYDPSRPYLPIASITASHHFTPLPNPYNPYDPAEQAAYRATLQAQLFLGNTTNQRAENQQSGSGRRLNYTSNPSRSRSHNDPGSQPPTAPPTNLGLSQTPSTPPNNSSRVRYPSTPPNRPLRNHHRTSSLDSLSGLVASTTLRTNTNIEPIAESKMDSLTAPDHYKPFEIYALEVERGDYIQSVQNPGEVTDHYPCEAIDHQRIGENEARPVSPNGGLKIIFRGADGKFRTKVFKGLEKVQVLREVAGGNEAVEAKKEEEN